MGFSCSIFRVNKRSEKPLSLQEYSLIDDYFHYTENYDFYKDQFPTVEAYAKRYKNQTLDIDMDIVDLYHKDFIERDNEKSIFEPLGYWQSAGSYFHDWVVEQLSDSSNNKEESFKLTQQDCLNLLQHCLYRLVELKVVPVILSRAFTEKYNEEEEQSTITSVPCDGIEVITEDNNLKRLYGDTLFDTDIFTMIDEQGESSCYDSYQAHLQFAAVLTAILHETDWNNQNVFYSGGW